MTIKNKVCDSYEKIAEWYDKHRSRDMFEKSYLDIAISYLKPGAKVLDLGCGMGEPITKYFIDNGFLITGIDGSQKKIDLARSRFPESVFIVHDMRNIELGEKFDCIIAWDSLFHLPQDDQRAMFQTFKQHLNERSILLFTSGSKAGEIYSDNGGESLYHASLSPDEYKKLLNKHHFELVAHKVEDKDCHGHTVWLAIYKSRQNSFEEDKE